MGIPENRPGPGKFAADFLRKIQALWCSVYVLCVLRGEKVIYGASMKPVDKALYNELLIGCGREWSKRLCQGDDREWKNLHTLDINSDHNPDTVWDLTDFPLPFDDDSFDEIHAYEVLEHTGNQGDYKFFFAQFSEFWRILKPGGVFAGTAPHHTSVWAFGDPSHTRTIQKEQFTFLDQTEYTNQVGKTSMSDFRYLYKADFSIVYLNEGKEALQFVLKAVKPSRIMKG